jgi:hypothetical protein
VKRVLIDTNIYIDWLNNGAREPLMLGPGLVRYLSAVVVLELKAGAKSRTSRRSDQSRHSPSRSSRAYPPRYHLPALNAFAAAKNCTHLLPLTGRP